jgi:hypothetical protein
MYKYTEIAKKTHSLPLYQEHNVILPILRESTSLSWSLLCPGVMRHLSSRVLTPEQHTLMQHGRIPLQSAISEPPNWRPSLFRSTPLVGTFLDIITNASRYEVALEDVAEFMAVNMTKLDGTFSRKAVGIKNTET